MLLNLKNLILICFQYLWTLRHTWRCLVWIAFLIPRLYASLAYCWLFRVGSWKSVQVWRWLWAGRYMLDAAPEYIWWSLRKTILQVMFNLRRRIFILFWIVRVYEQLSILVTIFNIELFSKTIILMFRIF